MRANPPISDGTQAQRQNNCHWVCLFSCWIGSQILYVVNSNNHLSACLLLSTEIAFNCIVTNYIKFFASRWGCTAQTNAYRRLEFIVCSFDTYKSFCSWVVKRSPLRVNHWLSFVTLPICKPYKIRGNANYLTTLNGKNGEKKRAKMNIVGNWNSTYDIGDAFSAQTSLQ